MTHFAVAVIAEEGQQVDDLLAPYQENTCGTPSYEYMEFYGCEQCSMFEDGCEDCSVDPLTGKRGYWENPNATWDWYDDTGGRFKGWAEEFGVGAGKRISDIEYPSEEQRAKAEKWYDENVDEDGKLHDLFGWTWGYAVGMTRGRLAEIRSHLSFRCVVTPDGEWHECGDTGWWGYYGENPDEVLEWALKFEERFLEPYRDCTLTVVDCHI